MDPTTVLIVDDDDLALTLLSGVLTDAGYDVLCARGGEEAIEILRDHECQLVISDWMMEGMSGPELCQEVRDKHSDRYVYFILLTANNSSDHVISGFEAGADDFIAKPFNASELLSRLRVSERVLSLENHDVTIFALAKLAESRDCETVGHLERVQRFCRVLAINAWRKDLFPGEIDAEFCRLIYETAPLHDIGKVAIPDAVLLKPGRLSPDEFEIMKSHALLGAQTLDAALEKRPKARFLRLARDIAAAHHEKWDGTGYPFKLAGTDIPLAARIVAVADVYDALISRRVYKPAFTPTAVRAIIEQGRGTHFDPKLVDLFLEVEAQFLKITQEFVADEVPAAVPASPPPQLKAA